MTDHWLRRRYRYLPVLLLGWFSSSATSGTVQFHVMEIEPPEGYHSAAGVDLNSSGEVVGHLSGILVPFLWDAEEGARTLCHEDDREPATGLYQATRINDSGEILGSYSLDCFSPTSSHPDCPPPPAPGWIPVVGFWDRAGQCELDPVPDLAELEGFDSWGLAATTLTNSGEIVGVARAADPDNDDPWILAGISLPFHWDGAVLHDMRRLGKGQGESGSDVEIWTLLANDAGQFAGSYFDELKPDDGIRLFTYDEHDGFQSLPRLSKEFQTSPESPVIFGFNNQGQIVGELVVVTSYPDNPDCPQGFECTVYESGFLWDPASGLTYFGPAYEPRAINNHGDIVALYHPDPAIPNPAAARVVLFQDGQWHDLEDLTENPDALPSDPVWPRAINDERQILVAGWSNSFLFSPTTCAGTSDLNCDGVVDVFDMLLLLSAWGPCPDPGDCDADLNGDGVVDVYDLLLLLSDWSG